MKLYIESCQERTREETQEWTRTGALTSIVVDVVLVLVICACADASLDDAHCVIVAIPPQAVYPGVWFQWQFNLHHMWVAPLSKIEAVNKETKGVPAAEVER